MEKGPMRMANEAVDRARYAARNAYTRASEGATMTDAKVSGRKLPENESDESNRFTRSSFLPIAKTKARRDLW